MFEVWKKIINFDSSEEAQKFVDSASPGIYDIREVEDEERV